MLLASAIASGIALGSIYALVAAGLNLIFGVVKIINFAQGALLTIALYCMYVIHTMTNVNPYLLLPAVVVFMGLLGWGIQVLLIDRVLGKERTSQLLITFGLAMALQNIALSIWGPDHRSVNVSFASKVFVFFGVRIDAAHLIAVAGSVVAVTFLFLFLQRTRTGTAIRAVAQQPESAELSGIDVKRIFAIAFTVGTALTGVAATLMSPIYFIEPGVGDIFGVMAFIVVILGGLGSVFGATIAALLIGILQNVFATMVNVQMATAFVFLVFIVLMIARPNGLFGRTARVA